MTQKWDFINRKLKEFFENRKNHSIDKLFTLHTCESTPMNILRKPHLDFETQPDEDQPISKPLITSQISAKKQTPKSFNQLTHLFSPHGPARSSQSMQMRMIVTGILKDDSGSYNSVKQTDIKKMKEIVDQKSKKLSRSSLLKKKINNDIQTLLTEFDDQLEKQKSPKMKQSPYLRQFVKKSKEINTISMKARIKSQQQITNSILQKSPSPSLDNFSKMNFEKHKDERVGLDRFLTNKWLEFIIQFKTMRKSDKFESYLNDFMKSAQAQDEIQKLKEKKEIRRFYHSPIIQPNFRPQQFQRQQYNRKQTINQVVEKLNENLEIIDRKMDEDNLIEFHPKYYSYKIKRKRLIKKLKALIQQSIRQKISIRQLINTFQSRAYEQKGSIIFMRSVKNGQAQAVIQILTQNPKLISTFDELGQYAIHLAVQRRNIEMVKILLNFNADINIDDAFKQKPLYFALLNDQIEMIKLLLSYGASCWDVDTRDYFAVCQSQDAKDVIKLSHFLSIQSKCLTYQQQAILFEQIQFFNKEEIKLALDSFKKQ